MMRSIRTVLLVLLLSGGVSTLVIAQCPMCKISAESNLKNGGTAGRGLNKGILYMLALPYTLVATLGYIWWSNNRRKEEEEVEILPLGSESK